jgi:glycosyltransferase involved in cell wall biosynthesis
VSRLGSPISSITIVTPCFNAEGLIGRTAESIVGQTAVQSGRVRLQYLVCDGASSDRTLEVVRRVCGSTVEVHSEKDGGMYEALGSGLRRATGDVVAYLNAGDLYSPTAFDVVADVLEQTDAKWITGLRVAYDARGQFLWSEPQYRYRRGLIRAGRYGGRMLPRYIQQESTFWRREMHEEIDYELLARLELAGDYYLWTRFARRAELRLVHSHRGGVAYHAGQKSEAIERYRKEVEAVTERPSVGDSFRAAIDGLAWRLGGLRSWVHGRDTLRCAPGGGRWTSPGGEHP